LGTKRIYAVYFMMVYLVINVLLLLNYVIAIMTDRYADLQESRLGLFYDGLVGSMVEYKYDSTYGFLILNFLPFNLVNLLIAPIFIFTKNVLLLKQLNQWLTVIGYLPIGLIVTVIFFVANTLMLPFAYVIGFLKKVQLILTGKSSGHYVLDLVYFVALGWLSLTLNVLIDTVFFMAHLFSKNFESIKSSDIAGERPAKVR
jgi:hypothetical protein